RTIGENQGAGRNRDLSSRRVVSMEDEATFARLLDVLVPANTRRFACGDQYDAGCAQNGARGRDDLPAIDTQGGNNLVKSLNVESSSGQNGECAGIRHPIAGRQLKCSARDVDLPRASTQSVHGDYTGRG